MQKGRHKYGEILLIEEIRGNMWITSIKYNHKGKIKKFLRFFKMIFNVYPP